jgi:hypothetical protein
MKSRSIRRHHRERLKKLRRFHWGRDLSKEPIGHLSMVVDTPTPCSCSMCCNPRSKKSWRTKCYKETIQERRHKQKEKI